MAVIEHTASAGPSIPRTSQIAAGSLVVVGAFLLVAVLAAFGTSAAVAPLGSASPFSKFASLPSPTSVSASSSGLVALSSASCSSVYSIASNGSVRTLATLAINLTKCPEGAVAVSPGLGNFPAGEVFVLLAGELFEVPSGGSSTPVPATFALANLSTGNMGLTFDASGNFGYTLIATGGSHGAAVEIDAANALRSLGSFGVGVEGPAVAPMSFGSSGGQLVVAESYKSGFLSMAPNGTVQAIAAYGSPTDAEAISFVPSIACSFAGTGDAYFVAATSANAVLAVHGSALRTYAGSGLLLSEGARPGLGLLRSNGSTSSLLKLPGTHEGASYASCPVGVARTVDLGSKGFNGTELNLIGYDPVTQQIIGADPTGAPSQIFLLNGTSAAFVQNVSTGLDPSAAAYDPLTNELFVADAGSDNLTILNASTYQELGNVSTGAHSSPVGVAFNSANSKLYVANSGNDTLIVFSVANRIFHNPNQVISLPSAPSGLVADPCDGNVYAIGNVSGNGTVWEVHAFKLVRTLSVGLDARSIAVNNRTGELYVTLYGSDQLAFVAPGDNLTGTVSISEPVGVAFNSRNGLVFVDSDAGSLSVFNGTSLFASFPFGAHPGSLVYDPASNLVWGAADVSIFGLDPRVIIGGAG